MRVLAITVVVAASFTAGWATSAARADDRLPTIPPAQYDADQKKAAVEFEAARKAAVFGPFEPLMHSPEVMTLARSMGDYLRYKSSIGNTLSEFVILVTARHWSQDYEWSVHAPIALKAGIRKELVDAVADGRRPVGMSADEEMTFDFASELVNNKRVSDPTYRKVQARFGDKGVVDMTGIVGYYSFLAMELNVAQYHPKDGTRLVRIPE